jgi:hypothetical protein
MTYGKLLRTLIFCALASLSGFKPATAQTIAPSNIILPSGGMLCWTGAGNCDSSISRDSGGGSGVFDFGTGAPNSTNGTINVGNISLNLLSAHGLLVSEAGSTLTGLYGTAGQCLISAGPSSDPSFQTCSGVILQTGGVNNTSQGTLNFQNGGSVNGLQIQPSNPSGGNEQMNLSGTLTVPGGGTGLSTLLAHQLYVGNGASTPAAVSNGAAGQVLISNGGSSDPSFQDPIISEAYVNLFNAISTTGTQTSSLTRIPNFNANGIVYYTFAGLSGVYTSCGITLTFADSLGNFSTTTTIISPTITNGTSTAAINRGTPINVADQVKAVWACSAYGSAGTLSVEFIPYSSGGPNDINGNLKVAQNSGSTAQTDAVGNSVNIQVGSNGSQFWSPSLGYVFNGTTWDRMRGGSAGSSTGYVATSPLALSSPLGDALSNSLILPSRPDGTVFGQQSYPYIFNGTGWDRVRSVKGISAGDSTVGLSSTGAFTPYVNLFNTIATTGTQTGSLARIPNFNLTGMVYFTFAGLSGSYSTCTITLKYADSLSNLLANTLVVSVGIPVNGTLGQAVSSNNPPTAAQLQAVWACAGYGTGGTLSADFVPGTNSEGVTSGSAVDALSNSEFFPLRQNAELVQKIFPYVFNGTTWDRVRGSGVSNGVVTGALVNVPVTQTVAQNDGLGNSRDVPTAGNGNIEFTPIFPYIFNGTGWDRVRSVKGISAGDSTVGLSSTGSFTPYVNLFNAISATGTQTSALVRIPNFNISGNVYVTFAGLTGTYTSCTVTLKYADSLGDLNPNTIVVFSGTPSNVTTMNATIPTSANLAAAQIQAVWACGAYGSAGTVSAEFVPSSYIPAVLGTTTVSDGLTSAPAALLVPGTNATIVDTTLSYVFNGTTWDRARSVKGISAGDTTVGLSSTGAFTPYVNLFNAISTVATQTSSLARIPNFNTAGSVIYTFAGLTGVYTSCTLTFRYADSLGNLIGTTLQFFTGTPSNGTSSSQFNVTSVPGADQIQVAWACAAYGTGGNVSVDFVPNPGNGYVDGTNNLRTVLKASATVQGDGLTNTPIISVDVNGNFIGNETYNYVFSGGTTWDRVRSAGIGNNVTSTGIVASAQYGQFNTSLPTITSGNYTALQTDSSGRMLSTILSGGAAADAFSNALVETFNGPGATNAAALIGSLVFNGTTWDRRRAAVGTTGVAAVNTEGTKATYHLSGFVTPGAAPTDVINLQGSGTKTIRILHIQIYPVATAAGTVDIQLVRRSTANSGGTSSAPAIGKNDSSDAAATLAQLVYTANPTSTGTTVANLGACRTSVITSGALAPCVFDYTTRNDKGLRLSGTSEFLSINGNGATLLTGETWAYDIEWSEE